MICCVFEETPLRCIQGVPIKTIHDLYLQQSQKLSPVQLRFKDSIVNHEAKVGDFLQGANYVFFWVAPIENDVSSAALELSRNSTIIKSQSAVLVLDPVGSSLATSTSQSSPAQSQKRIDSAGYGQDDRTSGTGASELLEVDLSTERWVRSMLDDPELLEAAVTESVRILQELDSQFSQYARYHEDAESWKAAIRTLIPQAERTRTVIGVVGQTGAGKSSVINAVLDQESLVPTNCMRACTAVVTEISFNDSTEASAQYRAEIEFIDRQAWEQELTLLIQDVLTASSDSSNMNSEASIAWAKFESVHPNLRKEELDQYSVSDLMNQDGVSRILGTTIALQEAHSDVFHQKLQRYVDSRQKCKKRSRGSNKDNTEMTEVKEMEYWPLIKVVRIYTKSSALSTGAVIVDLPGVQDSNAARAAVAQNYLKNCTGLWVVAPIVRAVDDKAAKNLLGTSFKRQLKYDGGFSDITFICSKTDDLLESELTRTLEIHGIEQLERERDEYQASIRCIDSHIEGLQTSKRYYKNVSSTAIEDLQELPDDGEWTRARETNKRTTSREPAKKRRRVSEGALKEDFILFDDDFEDDASEGASAYEKDEDETADERPCVNMKLEEVRLPRRDATEQVNQINKAVSELKRKKKEHKSARDQVQATIKSVCIAARNEYSGKAIQKDFAAGIKELDQEHAAEEDEDHFDPAEELRDYDQMANSLPVFCVSSRAYQKLRGRLRKDSPVLGFPGLEETGIPGLQSHCRQLTAGGRIQTCRTFLLNFSQLLTTFDLWASNDTDYRTTRDGDGQAQFLDPALADLKDKLDSRAHACSSRMREETKQNVADKLPEITKNAATAARGICDAWGKNGMCWSTYSAVIRRFGVFRSPSAGLCDFNADLVEPIMKHLVHGWERLFRTSLPTACSAWVAETGQLLRFFHRSIVQQARVDGTCLTRLPVLEQQITTYERLFQSYVAQLLEQMKQLQREANRSLTPAVANSMRSAYTSCASVASGRGVYKRTKDHLMKSVAERQHEMFDQAANTLLKQLDQMCDDLQALMLTKTCEIYARVEADYRRVLGSARSQAAVQSPTQGREQLRGRVREILESVEARFERISGGNDEIIAAGDLTGAERVSRHISGQSL
jgi:hypothetical protein